MTFNIPNVFVAGKKAVAYDVNENFGAIKDEINLHKTSISTLTSNYATLNNYVTEEFEDNMTNLIKSAKALFCVNSGNLNSSGEGDLLAIDTVNENRIVFKVGDGSTGNLAPVIYSNVKGNRVTRTSLTSINMQGQANGTYIVYGKTEGAPYALKGTLYKTKVQPTMSAGDVWLNTSTLPLNATKYNGVSYTDFEDIPIGEAIMSGGALTSVKTYNFNDNGYDINSQSNISSSSTLLESIFSAIAPKYSEYQAQVVGTTYTASSNGYVYVKTNASGTNATLGIGGLSFEFQTGSGSHLLPVKKGMVYRVVHASLIYFIPHS